VRILWRDEPRDAHRRAVGEDEETIDVGDQTFELRDVGHEPRPWATGQEWAWRTAVANAIRDASAASGRILPLAIDGKNEPHLSVEIVFRMSPPRFLDADLDNLAKPVLDTLFRAKRVQLPQTAGEVSGVLFAFDDSRVVRLVLEKLRVESVAYAGMDVIVEHRSPRR
jgi:hypothetical protein